MNEQEKVIINNIKMLGIDMIAKANSGHSGIVLGAAPIMYTLFANHLNSISNAPEWINRDRFVMSAGHGSALLYATLFMAGFDIKIEDLKAFRQIDSITPGHPEVGVTPGVDMTTGPLGQGLASAVGLALGERYLRGLAKEFNPKQIVIDHFTYVLVGDGDLMEGVAYEASSIAGNQKLGKLIVLYDSNNISLDGSTDLTFNEDVMKRYEAMGWHTQTVKNGESIKDIDKAIIKAKVVSDKPSIIEIKTVIGSGSALEGTNAIHGKPLSAEDISNLRTKLNVSPNSFEVSKETVIQFSSIINKRTNNVYSRWAAEYNSASSNGDEKYQELLKMLSSKDLNIEVDIEELEKDTQEKEEFREANAVIMNNIAAKTPYFVGGSADLSSSTMTLISASDNMSATKPLGRNICFGVREHAMGAILNGLSLMGLKVFGSTFLSFSNYMIPAIRMSALMNLDVTYIFTHDSITIGEDGPTHQPIEQLTQLRAIPNLTVIRPADVNELVGAWQIVVKGKKPTALIVAKGVNAKLPSTGSNLVSRGAYIVRKENGLLSGVIVASGMELKYAMLISEHLESKNIFTRVVSMPCGELFLTQGREYKEGTIPSGIKTIAIEFGLPDLWVNVATDYHHVIGVRDFGYSGKKDDVLAKFDLDFESLKTRVENLFIKE